MMNVFLIVGAAVLAVIVVAVLFFVGSAWAYAKSSRAQIAEELEDNGSIEGSDIQWHKIARSMITYER